MAKNLLAGVLMLLAALATQVVAQNQGFRVSGRQLLDANGNEFIMRGINHPHAWFTGQLNTSIPAIAATGANAVRVVMATGGRWTRTDATQVRNIIQILKQNNLIGILEVHDCTGYSEQSGSVPLSQAVDYWLSADIRAEIVGQEAFMIINIANEPFGNNIAADTYISEHQTAIVRMRQAGLRHALMVDAANWGQDWRNTMRDRAGEILQADPDRNIIFSVHMYDVYSNNAIVGTYLRTLYNNNIATVVGEFAADHGSSGPVAAQAILDTTAKYRQGYLGWSWKGNSAGLESLDIAVNWNGTPLTPWGELLVNGRGGLRTATRASVFTQTPSSSAVQSSSSRPSSSSALSSSSRPSSSSAGPVSSALPLSSSFIGGTPLPGGISGFTLWGVYVDALGSTVNPEAGSSPIVLENGVNAAIASFTIVPEPTWVPDVVLEYPFVGMLMEFRANSAVENLTGTTGIRLSYRSAGAVRMSLNQVGMPGGQEWGIMLPPAANYTTVTFTLAQLSQPGWVEAATALNLSQITGVKWELKEVEGGAGNISINSLQFVGWSSGSTRLQVAHGSASPLMGIGLDAMNNLQLDLRHGGATTVEILDVLGQRVWNHRQNLTAGVHSISLPDITGPHLVRVRQGAIQHTGSLFIGQ